MKKLKSLVLLSLGALTLVSGSIVGAETVYFSKGGHDYALSWEYGRSWGVISYSKVNSSELEHHATANTTGSGWQAPGVLASAQQWVGSGAAFAYWNAR